MMATADSLPSLLLLPPAPSPVTPASISAAYHPSIDGAVSILKSSGDRSRLFVVLPIASLHGRLDLPRAAIYDEVQKLVGSVYSLICLICALLGADVDCDTPGSIDARILVVDYESKQAFSVDGSYDSNVPVSGPVIDLPTLAKTRRAWKFIFSVDGEVGQNMLGIYHELVNVLSPPLQGHVTLVRGGVSMVRDAPISPSSPTSSTSFHSVVAVGGTFDHIHAGHKLLLTATALLLQPARNRTPSIRRLVIGITGDELLKNKKYAEYLKTWKQRQEDVVDFLTSILSFTLPGSIDTTRVTTFNRSSPNGRAVHTTLMSSLITIECVEIQDPFGPTITDKTITALVVSGETRSGGQAVNEKRKENGWNTLEVFEVDVLDADERQEGPTKTVDFASKISSTAIRKKKAENARISSL